MSAAEESVPQDEAVDDDPAGDPQKFAAEFIHAMLAEREEYGILGDFVMVGEVLDPDGKAHLMVVTSPDLVEWRARGMMLAAEDFMTGFSE